MSKMNELTIDHDAYAEFVESQNNEYRKEGAKELLIELVRQGVVKSAGSGMYTHRITEGPDAGAVKFIALGDLI